MQLPDPDGLIVPELRLPFPAREHPDCDEIERRTLQWTRDAGLLESSEQEAYVAAIGIGRWFPSILPHGDVDAMLLGSCMCVWETVLDDRIGESGDLALLMREIVEHESVGRLLDRATGILGGTFADLCRRLNDIAAPDQVLRIQHFALTYCVGQAAEAAYVRDKVRPTIVDYKRVRQLTAGVPLFYVLSEVCRGLHIPARTFMRPEALKLSALGAYLAGAASDIIALPRDLRRADPLCHARLLVEERGCTYQEALDMLATEFDQYVASFMDVAEQLRRTDPDYGPTYVEIIQDVVAGHLKWTKESSRYAGEWSLLRS